MYPKGRRGRRLLPRLRENARVLVHSYETLAAASRETSTITPAAEWLVDNFHIVEDRSGKSATICPTAITASSRSSRRPLAGYPRVFGLAWAFVAHTDSRFDPETLRRFVRAYQRVQPLTIGELWAVAITLAPGARREPAPPGRAHRARARGAPGGRRARRRACSASAAPPSRAGAACSSGSRAPLPTPSRSSSSSASAIRIRRSRRRSLADERLAARDDGRRDRPRRAPAAGRDERHRTQRHHQHAPDVRRSTGRSSSRASAWSTRRSATGTPGSRRWTSRPATATGTPSRSWRAAPARRARGGPARASGWRRSARTAGPSAARRSRRAIPGTT